MPIRPAIFTQYTDTTTPTGRQFVLTTDRPWHGHLCYLCEPPSREPIIKTERGIPRHCGWRYDYTGATCVDQLELGDSLTHTYNIPTSERCRCLWFFVTSDPNAGLGDRSTTPPMFTCNATTPSLLNLVSTQQHLIVNGAGAQTFPQDTFTKDGESIGTVLPQIPRWTMLQPGSYMIAFRVNAPPFPNNGLMLRFGEFGGPFPLFQWDFGWSSAGGYPGVVQGAAFFPVPSPRAFRFDALCSGASPGIRYNTGTYINVYPAGHPFQNE